ncbi:MAG: hypothetical protein V7699_07095, partial [Porticoccus sp.]
QHDILREEDVERHPSHEATTVNLEIPILTDRYDDGMTEPVSPVHPTPVPSTMESSTSRSAPNQTHLFDKADFDHSGS